MKKIKIITLLVCIATFSSCEITNFGDELLVNPNLLQSNQADPNYILNNVQVETAQFLQNLNRTTDEVMRYTWLNETYAAVSNDTELNFEYTEMYAVLEDSKIITIAAEENDAFRFHRGMSNVLTAYMLTSMVDYLGDIPFSEANKATEGIFEPKADDDEEIYNKMLERIDEAIVDFNAGTAAPINDLFYNGNRDQWIRLANSLKLKLYVNMGNKSAINNLITTNNFIEATDDFQFNYSTTQTEPNSRHPDFNVGYTQGGAGFSSFIGNTFINYLFNGKTNKDPRIRYYLYRQSTTDPSASSLSGCTNSTFANFCYIGNQYYGRDHGDLRTTGSDRQFRVTYGLYPVGGAFDDDGGIYPAFDATHIEGAGIMPILLSSFVDFLRAESALKLETNDDAMVLLESGIRKSMNKVLNFGGGTNSTLAATTAQVNEYVAEVIANYMLADASGKLNIVAEEFYLAAYGNSAEAYNGYRRTGYPNTLGESISNKSIPFPRVFSYPTDAIVNNGNIEQRPITTQVFWDTNPAGFIK